MQNEMRDRLIELVKQVPYGVSVGATFEQHFCEKIADHLIAHGVTFKDVPDTNVGEWISVEDGLPDRDGRYLVAMKNGDNYHISTRKFRRANPPIWWKGHTFGYWARYTGGVRYWAPLPQPPKGE